MMDTIERLKGAKRVLKICIGKEFADEANCIDEAIKALESQQILESALEKMAITALSSQGMVISQESIKEMCDASKQRAAYFINGIGGYRHE